ncbi:MAG: hypothetical protein JWN17_1610 [Frankiales bacterium]|nr:hypothetical protein [Frankiales bacterium]
MAAAPDTATTVVPPRVRPRRWPTRLEVAAGVAVALGVLSRTHSASALWLDETLSVNIATLPLHELPAALRRDGAPPLYYLLLHVWTAVLGSSDVAVRALSELLGLAALPLAWLVGRRLHSEGAGTAALLLLASSPFAVRYATETRMYALVLVLVLLGVLALHAALRDPRPARLAALSVLAALLALTHYWALFLLAVVGAGLAVAAVGSRAAPAARRCLLALAGGGVLFLPWLPTFLFQTAHTGTPWARPPAWTELVSTWQGWSGPGLPGAVLGVLLLVLVVAAPFVRPGRDGGVLLRAPARRLPLVLAGTALATLGLGLGVTVVQSSGYALRYSAVALVPALLAAAVAVQGVPGRARTALLGALVLLGTASVVRLPFDDTRTQARVTAGALAGRLAPGDLVLYCPDQLGPAVDRLLPPGTDQLVYPTGGRPERVDWVDYAARNAAGDPERFAAAAARRARGAVYLVTAGGYRTFGQSCAELADALAARRGPAVAVSAQDRHYEESQAVLRFPGPGAGPA